MVITFESKSGKRILLIFILFIVFTMNFYMPFIDGASKANILNNIKYLIKTLVLLMFLAILLTSKKNIQIVFVRKFLKGLYYSFIIHSIYSLIVLLVWYLFWFDLHTSLMNHIGITSDTVGHPLINWVTRPILRASGLHWDPANIALWSVIGIFTSLYTIGSKKKRLITINLFLLTLILTFSRNGLFTFFAMLIVISILNILRINDLKFLFKFSYVNVFWRNLMIFGLVFVMFVIPFLKDVDIKATSRIVEVRTTKNHGTTRHLMYPIYGMQAISVDPFHFLFGYGNRNSGRGLAHAHINLAGKEHTENNTAYEIESDWWRYLINNGVSGFILFIIVNLSFFFYLIKSFRKVIFYKEVLMIFVSLLATFIAGFFYMFSDSKWVWLVYFSGLIIINLKSDANVVGSRTS